MRGIKEENILEKIPLSDDRIVVKLKGEKSAKDFKITVYDPSIRRRHTPKHAHIAIDLYGKLCFLEHDAKKLFELIEELFKGKKAKSVLKNLSPEDEKTFDSLPGYSAEYILVTLELIFEQEDINYPPPRYEGRKLGFNMLKAIVNGEHPVEAMKRAGLRI